MSRRLHALLLGLVAAVVPQAAAMAHGSLPISVGILRTPSSSTLYMPVFYWGLWVGDKAGPWKWICEEAINSDRFRRYAVSTDGTIYATSAKGVSFSRQNGCAWPTATGELAELRTRDVVVDPTDPATAFVAAGSDALDDGTGKRTPAANGLFVTHDRGDSFARVAGIGTSGRTFDSVRVAPTDGKIVYASSTDYNAPFGHELHRSDDGGLTFVTAAMAALPDRGDPAQVEIMAVDPRDPHVVYARVGVTDGESDRKLQLLVRIVNAGDPTQTADEITAVETATLSGNWNSGINDMAFDLAHDQLFVATRDGLLQGSAALASQPLTLTPAGWSADAQCVDVASGDVFVCASAFGAGSAAIMSGSAADATLAPLFDFTGTVGPIDCPDGTPVHDICGPVWASYAFQLGIGADPSTDGGTSDGGDGQAAAGGCAFAGASHNEPVLAIVVIMIGLGLARRRSSGARRRSSITARALWCALAVLAAGEVRADAPALALVARDAVVTYHIVHKLHRVDGTSKKIDGRARMQPGGPTQLAVRIPVESFDSGNTNRDAHMKEAVEAASYPNVELKAVADALTVPATFPSTVQKTFRAQLTFHGVTQAIELPVTLRFEAADRVVASTSFSVSLDAYKVERPSLMFVKIDDAMKIDAKLTFSP